MTLWKFSISPSVQAKTAFDAASTLSAPKKASSTVLQS
eukprot:CAMPEP_0180478242 /NCGR_PEP_ID=MMETSP1036_2-20121128/32680_1 /TAXON_ID=632150 /ORGANISM="Azadinium spinosum, Strain 3D9" /LENGTH=37 /DNA_ID= /DNA_START= /DNA_END= /DNA_ORIENTATION=